MNNKTRRRLSPTGEEWTIPQLVSAVDRSDLIELPVRYAHINLEGQECDLTAGEALMILHDREEEATNYRDPIVVLEQKMEQDFLLNDQEIKVANEPRGLIVRMIPDICDIKGVSEAEALEDVRDKLRQGVIVEKGREGPREVLFVGQTTLKIMRTDESQLERAREVLLALSARIVMSMVIQPEAHRVKDYWRLREALYPRGNYESKNTLFRSRKGLDRHVRTVIDLVNLCDREMTTVVRLDDFSHVTLRDCRALNMNGITVHVERGEYPQHDSMILPPGIFIAGGRSGKLNYEASGRPPEKSEWLLELPERGLDSYLREVLRQTNLHGVLVYMSEPLRHYEDYLYPSTRMSEGLVMFVNRRRTRSNNFLLMIQEMSRLLLKEYWSDVLRQPVGVHRRRARIFFSRPIDPGSYNTREVYKDLRDQKLKIEHSGGMVDWIIANRPDQSCDPDLLSEYESQ